MDVYSIKQHIIDNPYYIEDLLEESGFQKISNRGDEYRCAYDYDTNPTSVKVNKNTLGASDFGRGINGDIITLIQEKTNYGFTRTLKHICKIIGLDEASIPDRKEITLPFGGFFKNIGKNKEEYEELEILDEAALDEYELMPSKMFYDDGISLETQRKYGVGYDVVSGRIVIPHRDTVGNLVGIVGRCNDEEIPDGVPKYLAIKSFPKSKSIYAYHNNYREIQKKKMVIIGESEKSPMKLDCMGLGVGLAIGGNRLSQTQIRNIQSALPGTAILGLDEGMEEEFIREQARKLKINNPFVNINVGYIWDSNNEIIKKGSKAAPMDKSRQEFEYLMRNCVKYI